MIPTIPLLWAVLGTTFVRLTVVGRVAVLGLSAFATTAVLFPCLTILGPAPVRRPPAACQAGGRRPRPDLSRRRWAGQERRNVPVPVAGLVGGRMTAPGGGVLGLDGAEHHVDPAGDRPGGGDGGVGRRQGQAAGKPNGVADDGWLKLGGAAQLHDGLDPGEPLGVPRLPLAQYLFLPGGQSAAVGQQHRVVAGLQDVCHASIIYYTLELETKEFQSPRNAV